MKNKIFLLNLFTLFLFSCQEQKETKSVTISGTSNEIQSAMLPDTVTKNTNVYAELLRGIESQYEAAQKHRGVVPLPDERLEKLKALGFTRIKNVNAVNDSIELIKRANEQFETITHYRNKYPAYPFVHEGESYCFSAPGISMDFYDDDDEILSRDVIYKMTTSYNMRIFEAGEFLSMLPDSIIAKLIAFDLKSIDTKDLVEITCISNIYVSGLSLVETPERLEREYHEAHKHETYHDLDTRFKVLAPASEGVKIDDPIILFPVKHGYLVIAHWGYEAKP